MINVAEAALQVVEAGALAAGLGTVAAFAWAFSSERARAKHVTQLQLPDSVYESPDLYAAFTALVTPRAHVRNLERAARRLDLLLRLGAAVQSSSSAKRIDASMYRTAAEYESSIRHYLLLYFERSRVPVYDRRKRHMVPGEDNDHAKQYGPFPIPYTARCAHADILDAVHSIVESIHNVLPDRMLERAVMRPSLRRALS